MVMQKFYADFLDKLGAIHYEISEIILPMQVDALDWKPLADIPSIGVFVVHIAGAEKYWIGDVISGDDTGRIRENEFKSEGKNNDELIGVLDESLDYVKRKFYGMQIDDLTRTVISPRDGSEITVAWALNHAMHHTALHLGHIQIIRQLWESRDQ
ncbi:MAG: DinB family protein [Anaerolineales bacterium]|jgi:uncharacterized damage-inducible protein DinB